MTQDQKRAAELSEQYSDLIHVSWRSRIVPLSVVGFGLLYLVYLFFYFDFANIADKWRAERAQLFALDSYAYKVHVESKWRSPTKLKSSLEGSRWETFKELPDWVSTGSQSNSRLVSFGEHGEAEVFEDRISMRFTNAAHITVYKPENGKFRLESPDALPDWIRVSKSKVDARPDLFTRVQIYKKKIIMHRYFVGWEYFWFDFQSPLRDYSFSEVIDLVMSAERLDPNMSNLALVNKEFWTNALWLHKDVFIAVLQTIFMAVMGTLMAAILGLPLAFLAAYNVTPVAGIRFGLRRLFDALRGIDMLIWSLIFIRAFGMGPFSGLLAIGVTDTGTLGKLMSEAIENTDKKQVEGVQSTGASKVQQHRFGILPQILPLFISQTLYYLESNTRGAVIIGAMGAGGIGLQFLGAMRTGTDWENVAYISIIVLITVMVIDMISSRLRRKLIGRETH